MGNLYFESAVYNPWHNLAVEQYLAAAIKQGDVIFYLWQNDKTVVIGKNQNAFRECRTKLLEAEGGFLARRTTGGGAVYQDLGNLCFTFLAAPEVYDLERQMNVIINACESYGLHVCVSGRNDMITENGKKFSGNAFSYTDQCKVHHGTLMVDVDVEKMKRYLTPSSRKLRAKGVESVQSRVCNLKELNAEITAAGLKEALKIGFREEYGDYSELLYESFSETDIGTMEKLYASWEWLYGKSPDCEVCYTERFGWGDAEIHLKTSGMRIKYVKMYSDCLDADLPGVLEGLLIGKKIHMDDVMEQDIIHAGSSPMQRDKIREVVSWLAAIDI